MKKNKIIFFSIFTFFLIFFILEFSSRAMIAILAKNGDIFKYGFNKSIDLQIRKLSTLDFEVIDNNVLIHKKKISKNNKNEKKLIWTFGGSTSDTACRKINNTSWPNELANENFVVKNYGKSGTNSDFALNSLISSINLGENSDFILWANYVNETDVITLGFKRNPELGEKIEKKLNINKKLYFVKSLSKSIKNYSIFFFLLDDVSLRVIYRLNLTGMIFDSGKKLTKNDIKVSSENYYINTTEAISIAKKLNTKFYIVTLFSRPGLIDQNKLIKEINESDDMESYKEKFFFKTIKKIINENNHVKWINLKEYKISDNDKIKNMFCDNIHFTKMGNKTVAKIINQHLDIKNN